jgi:D-alanine-D-alanine ligase
MAGGASGGANGKTGDMKGVRVAVLKGGWSPEREVSLVSGAACADAARSLGCDVVEIDADRDVAAALKVAAPDIIFNALHGEWGEDGRVQGVLDILGVPYTHSGVLASALAMDKAKAKAVLGLAGLPLAAGKLMDRRDVANGDHPMPPPYVVKPNAQGSSVGVFIVRPGDNRPPHALLADDWTLGDDVMVEEFIAGRELAVAVQGDHALAVTEIVTAHEFYDYEAKYADGGSYHVVDPPDLPADVRAACMDAALMAHQALGCRGVTRSDFRYDPATGRMVILEVNTQPGMTPTSLAPEQAAATGQDFATFVKWMLEDASCPR